jgi:hypothetical protein
MTNVFQTIGISGADLAKAREIAASHFTSIGPKYERYVSQAAATLMELYPAARDIPADELKEIISVTDIIAIDSRGMMKRLKASCNGCGWCCSETRRIIVDEEDAVRISRKLKQKRDELFTFDGKDWLIKKAHPCGWWNPRNGRCLIYNDRPSTCRVWPLGVNDAGHHTVQPVAHCNYAVMVLVNKVIWTLESAAKGPATPAEALSDTPLN